MQNRESRDFRSQEVGISAHPMVRHPHAMLYLGCQWSASAAFNMATLMGGIEEGVSLPLCRLRLIILSHWMKKL